jgi:predicted porin
MVRRFGPVLVVFSLAAGLASAQDTQPQNDTVTVRGFGSAAYGKTDENTYTVGSEQGHYDNSRLALNFSAEPSDRLRFRSQAELEQEGEEIAAEIDFAFAEWAFSDALRLRAGNCQQPFGLYTEIFDVGTLRPFVNLPQGIYGGSGFAAEGFNGLALTGRIARANGWALQYDAYGGGARLVSDELDAGEGEHEAVRNALGLRIVLETPVTGLSVGSSVFTGSEEDERRTSYGLQAEYLTGPWSIRVEYAGLRPAEGADSRASYLELARRLDEHWQVGLRYDAWDSDDDEAAEERSLRRHRDWAASINYWFDPRFVLKLGYHRVDGNRFARPEDDDTAPLEERTNLVELAAQFSF